MEKIILIKYGELSTKKGNRNFFIKTLKDEVNRKLSTLPCEIMSDFSRMSITCKDEDLNKVLDKLNTIFGIHAYHIAYKIASNQEEIEKKVLEVMSEEKFSTFKIETNRRDKSFPISSMDFSRRLGGIILKNIEGVKVDVHHPDVLCSVEIYSQEAYIYTNQHKGLGGYPIGTQPKALLMLSGGIDSPVAGYLAMKRGIKIEAVYFEAIPHTSMEARNKVIELSRKLARYTNKINLHIVPFTELQEEIYKKSDPAYGITIMRRMMYRIMDKLCQKYKAKAIINGESIGQVASQTLVSMNVINEVTNLPVIRPLACFDKLEIMEIARKIDTYNTSILPYEDCCTIFVPKHPVIHPELEVAKKIEKEIDYETLIQKAIDNTFTIVVHEEAENIYSDLL